MVLFGVLFPAPGPFLALRLAVEDCYSRAHAAMQAPAPNFTIFTTISKLKQAKASKKCFFIEHSGFGKSKTKPNWLHEAWTSTARP